MNLFKTLLRKQAEENSEPMKKQYDCTRLEVRTDKSTGNLSIYFIEVESKDYYSIIRKATNIEDENDIVRYTLLALPGGRAGFGGYLDDYDAKNHENYKFSDIMYKLFGKTISSGTKYTQEELVTITKSFREHIKEAKYDNFYQIKYKDAFKGKRAFDGSIYIGAYYSNEHHKEEFENLLNGDFSLIKQADSNDVVIKLGDEEFTIGERGIFFGNNLYTSKNSPFEIEELGGYGSSHIYDQCRYTKTAIKQIIDEREQEVEVK